MTNLQSLKLLVIVGPTAVGKSAIAVELAERLAGEIISADSRYLYRGLDIGTAKPSLADRARVPHHLIDVTDPDKPWALSEYRQAVDELIAAINARNHWPLLVGGTGQYVRAVLEGWTIPPRAADPALRDELLAFAEREGSEALFRRLAEADPAAAQVIDRRNVRRVARALEVTLATGQPFSAQRQKTPPPYRSIIIGLTLARPILYARIDARIEAMMVKGLVAETQALADKGYAWSLPAMSALGYKQIGMCLRGECDLAEATRLIKHETRRFVRQQANWFRLNDPQIHWYDVEQLEIDKLIEDIYRLESQ
ncbi:MAG: tRNA (adenosine(37)-N6)-dimethylallyltransferase MiaA [Chloroflexi bacterium]|nr:tRNA (adenosine(37)-N6)-dimethylallyltransferase MiaA [Chloroflexota bacterium]